MNDRKTNVSVVVDNKYSVVATYRSDAERLPWKNPKCANNNIGPLTEEEVTKVIKDMIEKVYIQRPRGKIEECNPFFLDEDNNSIVLKYLLRQITSDMREKDVAIYTKDRIYSYMTVMRRLDKKQTKKAGDYTWKLESIRSRSTIEREKDIISSSQTFQDVLKGLQMKKAHEGKRAMYFKGT